LILIIPHVANSEFCEYRPFFLLLVILSFLLFCLFSVSAFLLVTPPKILLIWFTKNWHPRSPFSPSPFYFLPAHHTPGFL
jgi:hypothetical protein